MKIVTLIAKHFDTSIAPAHTECPGIRFDLLLLLCHGRRQRRRCRRHSNNFSIV